LYKTMAETIKSVQEMEKEFRAKAEAGMDIEDMIREAEVFSVMQTERDMGGARPWADILRGAQAEGLFETNWWRIAPSDKETGEISDFPFPAPNGYEWVDSNDYWALKKKE